MEAELRDWVKDVELSAKRILKSQLARSTGRPAGRSKQRKQRKGGVARPRSGGGGSAASPGSKRAVSLGASGALSMSRSGSALPPLQSPVGLGSSSRRAGRRGRGRSAVREALASSPYLSRTSSRLKGDGAAALARSGSPVRLSSTLPAGVGGGGSSYGVRSGRISTGGPAALSSPSPLARGGRGSASLPALKSVERLSGRLFKSEHSVDRRLCRACWAEDDKVTGGLSGTLRTSDVLAEMRVELQGPTNWSIVDLRRKWRGENERQQLYAAARTRMEAADDHEEAVAAGFDVEMHPVHVYHREALRYEIATSRTRARQRLKLKTFVLDVRTVWRSSAGTRLHEPTLTKVLRGVRPEEHGGGRMDGSQAQSVAPAVALKTAFRTDDTATADVAEDGRVKARDSGLRCVARRVATFPFDGRHRVLSVNYHRLQQRVYLQAYNPEDSDVIEMSFHASIFPTALAAPDMTLVYSSAAPVTTVTADGRAYDVTVHTAPSGGGDAEVVFTASMCEEVKAGQVAARTLTLLGSALLNEMDVDEADVLKRGVWWWAATDHDAFWQRAVDALAVQESDDTMRLGSLQDMTADVAGSRWDLATVWQRISMASGKLAFDSTPVRTEDSDVLPFMSGRVNAYKQVPGCELLPKDWDDVATLLMTSRDAMLSSSNALLATVATYLYKLQQSPLCLAWEDKKQLPPIVKEQPQDGHVRLSELPATAEAEAVDGVLDNALPPAILALNVLSEGAEERFQLSSGFRLTQLSSLLPPDATMERVVYGLRAVAAVPNSRGVLGRHSWHAEEAEVEPFVRSPLDFQYLLCNDNTLPAGSRILLTVVMAGERMDRLVLTNFEAYKKLLAEATARLRERARRKELLASATAELGGSAGFAGSGGGTGAGGAAVGGKGIGGGGGGGGAAASTVDGGAADDGTVSFAAAGIDSDDEEGEGGRVDMALGVWDERRRGAVLVERRGVWECLREVDTGAVFFFDGSRNRYAWEQPEEWAPEEEDDASTDAASVIGLDAADDSAALAGLDWFGLRLYAPDRRPFSWKRLREKSEAEAVASSWQLVRDSETEHLYYLNTTTGGHTAEQPDDLAKAEALLAEVAREEQMAELMEELSARPEFVRQLAARLGVEAPLFEDEEDSGRLMTADGGDSDDDSDAELDTMPQALPRLKQLLPDKAVDASRPASRKGMGWRVLKPRLAKGFTRAVTSSRTIKSLTPDPLPGSASMVGIIMAGDDEYEYDSPFQDVLLAKASPIIDPMSVDERATADIAAAEGGAGAGGAAVGLSAPTDGLKTVADLESEGESKACASVKAGRYAELEALLDDGLDANTEDSNGNTLLILAAQNGNRRIAKLLLRRGADINMTNLRGNTVLHYTVAYNFSELTKYLISKGADDTILNKEGVTCYEGLTREDAEAI